MFFCSWSIEKAKRGDEVAGKSVPLTDAGETLGDDGRQFAPRVGGGSVEEALSGIETWLKTLLNESRDKAAGGALSLVKGAPVIRDDDNFSTAHPFKKLETCGGAGLAETCGFDDITEAHGFR